MFRFLSHFIPTGLLILFLVQEGMAVAPDPSAGIVRGVFQPEKVLPQDAGASSNVLQTVGILEEWVKKHPDSEDARFQLALGLLEIGNAAAAEDRLKALIALNPKNGEALNELACLLQSQGRSAEALPLFDRVVALAPGESDYASNRADCMAAAGKIPEAEEIMRGLIRTQPGKSRNYNVLGKILMQKGSAEEGTAMFQKALELDPSNWVALVNMSVCRAQAGDMEGAGEYVRKAYEVAPRQLEVVSRLLHSMTPPLNMKPDTPKVEKLLAELEANQGENFPVMVMLMDFYMTFAAYDRVCRIGERLDAAGYSDPTFAMQYGGALNMLGYATRAMKFHEKALLLYPENSELLAQAGFASLKMGDATTGEAYYLKSLSAPKPPVLAVIQLGSLWISQGKSKQVLELVAKNEALLQMNTQGQSGRAMLQALAYLNLENLPQAEAALEAYVKVMPQDPEGWTRLADVKGRLGKSQEMMDAVKRASQLAIPAPPAAP